MVPGWWKKTSRWKIREDGTIRTGTADAPQAPWIAVGDPETWGELVDPHVIPLSDLTTAAIGSGRYTISVGPLPRSPERYSGESTDEEDELDSRTEEQIQNCIERDIRALVFNR